MDVTTTPHRLGSSGYLIQNQGPDALYVGEDDVDEDIGFRVLSGEAVAVGDTSWDIYVVSEGTSTVEILGKGEGLYSPPAEVPDAPDLTPYVAKALYDANTILTADTNDTPAPLTVAASRIVGRKASGGIAALTGAEVQALLDFSAYVTKALFDANTMLYATTDDTPVALTIGASTIVGRKSSGNIVALTPAEVGVVVGTEIFKQAQTINAQIGTSYTILSSDVGKLVTLSNGSGITVSMPQDSDQTIAVGSYGDLWQLGAGQVTVQAGSGATLRVSGLSAKSRAQYSRLGWQKVAANTFLLFGDLAAS